MFMHQHQALHADRPVETASGHRLLKVRRLCKPFTQLVPGLLAEIEHLTDVVCHDDLPWL
jgi:hypothetical protein